MTTHGSPGLAARSWSTRLPDGEKRGSFVRLRLSLTERVAFDALARRCGVKASQLLRLGMHGVLAAAEHAKPDREEPDAVLDRLTDLVTSPPVELVEALEPMLRAGEWAEIAKYDPPVLGVWYKAATQAKLRVDDVCKEQ